MIPNLQEYVNCAQTDMETFTEVGLVKVNHTYAAQYIYEKDPFHCMI
jgi:hypothetical protein